MLYLWSMKLAKGRCWCVPKMSYFLITWALWLEFDPNPTLLFTLISHQKWISVKVLVGLLWKKQDSIHTGSLVLALHKGQTLLSETFTISRDETQKEKKKSPDVTIATIHLFSTHFKLWFGCWETVACETQWTGKRAPSHSGSCTRNTCSQHGREFVYTGFISSPSQGTGRKIIIQEIHFQKKETPWEMTFS